MISKRVKAGLLSAVLAVSVLLAGGNALQVNAEVAGIQAGSSGVGDAIKISKNDLSVTSNRVGVCEITIPEAWRAPSNSSYYVSKLWGDTSWSGDYRKLSDEDWDAFESAVKAGQYTNDICSLTNGSDDTLTYTSAGGWCIWASQYLSSELTVVDKNTTTKLPGIFNTGYIDCPTYYYLCARKANDDWDVLFEYDYNEQDISFSWSDYLKDDYVYFLLYSSEACTDANTTVYRMFTTADKLDAVRQKLPEWTISYTSTASTNSGLVDGGDGNWYLFTDGAFNPNYTGLFYDANVGWWLVVDGRVAFEYNDLYGDANYGWWKITNGAVDFGYSDLYCSPTVGWWKVNGGAVDFGYSDLYCSPTYGWWLVYNGAVNFEYNDLFGSPQYGWWKVTNGTVDFNYADLYCSPTYGWWLVYGGVVIFDYSDLFGSPQYGWWKVNGGTVDFGYTGVYESPAFGPWNINGGAVVF